ncbi:MAG: 6-bladed beta-propeller [Culturomica sp.]|jgi:hypothetical protein|nr:6-bladed beta-propeller [Culturomica sp.]
MALLAGCTNQQKQNSRYTQEQIASLYLDSTTTLKTETDSMIKINLNPFLQRQHFDFGALIKSIKIIPLESTDESLLDNIYKVIVSDSHIYIQDNLKGGGIAIFCKDGKFIKRVPYGQGPGELSRLYDIAYDKGNNELIAYEHSFLTFFTASGEFIREEKLPFGFYNFTVIPDGYIFKTIDGRGNSHLEYLKDYTLFITDRKFKLKSVGMYCLPMGKVISGHDYLYNNNHNVIVTQMYSDTVYQYISKTKELKARYVLDYSKKKLPEHYLPFETYNDFDRVVKQNDYYYYIGRYLDTETHHVFFLENYNIGRTVIYRDKQSGNLTGGTNADYNMNETPPVAFPISTSDNWLISVYLPNQNTPLLFNSPIISDGDKLKIKNLTEDDNPVLVFFELKDF